MAARAFGSDEPRLRSLLDDQLPEHEQAVLADHLESCVYRRRLGRKTVAAMLVAVIAAVLVLGSSVAVQVGGGAAPSGGTVVTGNTGILAGQNGPSITIITAGDDPARPIIQGSGVAATKTWDVAGFDSVQIGSTFHTKIAKGSSFKVTTTADDKILQHIRVVKVDRTLKIGLESGSYSLKSPLGAEITMPTIAGLDLSGASKTALTGFDSERDIRIKLSGASELSGKIKAEKAEFVVDGASTATLSGSAAVGRLIANGSSHLKLGEFPFQQCALGLEGASSAQVVVQSDHPFLAKLAGSSHLNGSVKAADIRLDLSGASRATLGGSSKDVLIHGSGASRTELSEFAVNASKLSIQLDGASSAKLSGCADTALLEGNSASHLDLSRLVAQSADVKLTGSSHATIDVRGSLIYDLSSVSHLNFRGNPPAVTGKKSGCSTVSPRQ